MSYWDTSALVKLYVQELDSKIFEGHLLSAPSPPATSPSPSTRRGPPSEERKLKA